MPEEQRTSAEGPSLAFRVREAAAAVRARGGPAPAVGLILGSGLGDLVEELSDRIGIPYAEIPHFPVATVQGHSGELVVGTLEGVCVVAMRGRVHYYEGYSLREVTFPVRVMRRLGAEVLIVTNAAGGLNEAFETGDLMLIADHLNLMGLAGQNPLRGADEPELGVRFLDMLTAYDEELRNTARRVAGERGFSLRQGVYVMVGGPSYETRAEIRFLQRAGADAVGMSTVPEVLVARHEGMRVLGITAITDMAIGPDAVQSITHHDVLDVAERARPRLASLVRGVVATLA